MKRVALTFACFASLAGCAHAPHRASAKPTTVNMEPIVFVAHADGHVEVLDSTAVFDQAAAAYQDDRFADALPLFDRVVAEHPGTQNARSSLYNAGLCLEKLDRRSEAVTRFARLADENPGTPEALDALFRMGADEVALKDWPASEATHDKILTQKNLTLSDQIEAYARVGEARFQQGRLDDAEHTLRELRETYRQHEQEERLDTDYFLAMGSFLLAEISHAEYKALPVRLPQKQLEDDLEAKARMLLLAQQRYLDAMRVRHAEWATAAGFRIGSLYREFYDDLVGAPVPPALTGEAREVYLEQVKKKVRNLLVKAVAFHEKNILMAERIGEKNDWVRRSNAELDELRKLLEPGGPANLAPRPTPDAPPPLPDAPLRDVGGARTTM